MNRSRLLLTVPLAFFLAGALVLAAPPAHAQADLDEPVATTTVLSLSGAGTVDRDTLYLPLDQQVELRVSARDQYDRAFPQERLRFEFDFDRDCRGLVELVSASDVGVTLRAGKGAGTCNALLWLPNNMNADRRLRIVGNRGGTPGGTSGGTVTQPVTGAIDTREELVAVSLFHAVLGRAPDDRWMAAATDQIRRNQTREVIRSLLGSQEFLERRQARSPDDLLRDFYQGLLGREPDPSGVRRYRGDMQRANHESVIRDILDSREFRDRVAREIR